MRTCRALVLCAAETGRIAPDSIGRGEPQTHGICDWRKLPVAAHRLAKRGRNVSDAPPAGWYPDPTVRPEDCYWNGSAWEPGRIRPTQRHLNGLLRTVFISIPVSAISLLVGTQDHFLVLIIVGVAEALGAVTAALMYFRLRGEVGSPRR